MSVDTRQKRIRTAVFPVAGLGTRFLPATKTVPKEMLPIIDKPLIQYAVDEAVEAGCDTLVFITNRYKHAVADYFDKAYELEQKLERAGKSEQLDLIRNVLPSHVRAVFVTQAEALGLGHAVLCAKSIVGEDVLPCRNESTGRATRCHSYHALTNSRVCEVPVMKGHSGARATNLRPRSTCQGHDRLQRFDGPPRPQTQSPAEARNSLHRT